MKKTSLALVLSLGLAACGAPEKPTLPVTPEELLQFPLDSLNEVMAPGEVTLDSDVSSDGAGSIRVDATEPVVVPLLEVTFLDVQNAVLIYQARLRSENLDGYAYLQMTLHFPDDEEDSAQGRQQQVTGTTEWVTSSAPFFLQPGRQPDRVRLNLAVEGTGTVWIDDIHLLRQPLPSRP